MNNEWLYIGIFMVVSLGLPAVAIFMAGQYYLIGLVFLVFDIETVFLYPWAIAFDKIGLFAVLEGVLFILILAAGLLYAWKKGAFEWS
jgi:NADH:ubiquinone oxidoreductase subunit 3 (subunit A)